MSTNRYRNAGAPGTGTVTDNMKSRIKSWVCINNPAVTLVILDSFNTSVVTDNGVGDFTQNYTAPFAGAGFGRFSTVSAGSSINGWSQVNQTTIPAHASRYYAVGFNGTAVVVFDPALGYFMAMGDLA